MTEWQRIQANQFAFPEGGSVEELVAELVDMLASPDPKTRDEIALSALGTWVDDGVVPDDQLRPLGDLMARRFQADEVQARSFAPLVLDVIVGSRGVCEMRWVDAFEGWYATETDLRGHHDDLGWLHAVAHGADLLGTFGRRLEVEPRRMLDLGARRMLVPTDTVWHDQEHDRLAYALGKVLTRQDLSPEDASAWLEPVDRVLADAQPGPVPANVSNTLHTLRTLYVLVSRGVRVGPSEVLTVPLRGMILDRVADVLHPATPWMW